MPRARALALLVVAARAEAGLNSRPAWSLQVGQTGDDGQCSQQAELDAFQDYFLEAHASMSIDTNFGRTLSSGCACRYCDVATDAHVAPPDLTTSAYANLCVSTYPKPMTLIAGDENPDYFCKTQTFTEDNVDNLVPIAVENINSCLTPDRSNVTFPQRTIFLIGDSIAGAVLPGIALAVRGAYQVRSMYVGQYGMVTPPTSQFVQWLNASGQPKTAASLTSLYDITLSVLKQQMQAGDLLVIAQQDTNVLAANIVSPPDDYISKPTYGVMDAMEHDFIEGIVEPIGAKALILGAWETNERAPGRMNRKALARKMITDMVGRHSNSSHFIDMFSYFCDKEMDDLSTFTDPEDGYSNTTVLPECSRLLPGTTIRAFRDDFHINSAGAIYLWPYMCSALESQSLF
jgi:hypothetical protein